MNDYVTLADIPAMTGLTMGTVNFYRSDGRLPINDDKIGRTPVWKRTTIEEWNDTRNRRNT